MRTSSSNNLSALAVLLSCMAGLAQAQQPPIPPLHAPVPATAASQDAGANADAGDPLFDALTCRSGPEIARLLSRLRRDRPDDFIQTERQYSDPPMDMYRLEIPVQAWGQQSDAVVITANRVLMVVDGSADEVARTLEASLSGSDATPLSGPLDDQHALVLYTEERPGLQRRVLIGCEYRLPDLSLLDDPDDAWRKSPAPTAP
ncbi:hypothetical protein ACWKWK_14585 [Pseudoxanthomonas beigongshangi]